MRIFGLLLCCTLVYAGHLKHNINPIVKAPIGSFQGSILKSQSGKDIFSFRGIPYAVSPTGRDRFKHAHPVEPHSHIFNATKDGPWCPQPHNGNHEISEDCLHLNVYTTALPQGSKQPNRPVIVFLLPGAFIAPSGTGYDLGPEFLLNQDVVYVTPNFRLGALGFLSSGDKRAPGNAGLKDQVLALRWVQQNIKSFGGNPNSVTLMGHCVGSLHVSLHIVSPLSKGLFHRALGMSTYRPKDSFATNQKDLIVKQAEILGCPTDTLDNIFDCLYEISPEEYANSYEQMGTFSKYPFLTWAPVIEQEYSDDDDDCNDDNDDDDRPFLIGQPEDLIREGKANFVPYYTSANVDEFGSMVIPTEEQALNGNTTFYDELNNNWEELAPGIFDYESGTPRSLQISNELRSFYLNDEPLEAGKYQGLANLYADTFIFFHVHRFERLMATYSPEPVWYFQHHYKGCDTYEKWTDGKRFGIVHYDELLLQYKIADRPKTCSRDVKVFNEIWGLVVNFADTGNPIPESKADEYCFTWEPSTKEQPQYLEYKGEKNRMVSGVINQERMDKFDELFPLECDE